MADSLGTERVDDDDKTRGPAGQTSAIAPKAALLDVFALARRIGGWLSTADLVSLMRDLGFEDQVARAAISRMKRSGLLVSHRSAGVAGYVPSEEAREILSAGDKRIFNGQSPSDTDGGWVIVNFSLPEGEREKRYKLRSRLTWLGFGQVTPGTWIAPRHGLPDLQRSLERIGLTSRVRIFQGEYVGHEPIEDLIEETWDLPWLQSLYADFIEVYEPVMQEWRDAREASDCLAFTTYIRAISQWRRLPYVDPGLPAKYLPADWAGHRANALFAELRATLELRSLRHLASSETRGRKGERAMLP